MKKLIGAAVMLAAASSLYGQAPPPTAPGPDMRRQVLRPEFNEVTFLYPAGLNAVVSCQAQQDGKDDKAGVERCENEGRVRYLGLFERAKIRLKMQDHLSGSESFQSFVVTTGKLVIPPLARREQVLAQRISYVDVDAAGNLSNCRFDESGPFIANVLPAHNLCQRVVRVQPFRDASGKPTAGQFVVLYRVTAHSFSQAEAKARFPSWPF